MIRFTFGSGGIARYRYEQAVREFGGDHPATRAAHGRLLVYLGGVPQRDSRTIESIAWLRESRAIPGVCNRGERKGREPGRNPAPGRL